MAKLQKRIKARSITIKFILWFLVISLVPLIIATYISYSSSCKLLEEAVSKSLLAVADNKANQVEAFLREKEEGIETLSRTPEIINAIELFDVAYDKGGVESEEYKMAYEKFGPLLAYYQRRFGYDDVYLIRSYGDVVFSVNKKDALHSIYIYEPYKDSQLSRLFIEVSMSPEPKISDFEYSPRTKEGAIYIAAPVFKEDRVIGAVVAQMGNKGIFEVVRDYKGLGRTGEIVLASKFGETISFITPLRFDPDAAFKRRIKFGSPEGLAEQKAIQGEKGSGISVDYRGKEVLAVWRYLPSFRWAMVAKMDTDEVYDSAGKLRNTLFVISLGLLALVVIMAVIIANSIANPIRELTKVSGVIANGDLSARARIKSKDEIGELAQSFNQMTDSLLEAKASVEQKKAELEVQKRLLEKANKELDSFVYTASHDLRAPLRGIVAFANFLEEDYKDQLNKEGQDFVKEIKEGAKRMNDLIDDLLKLSHISRIQNPYEDVNMNELLDAVVKRLDFDIKEINADLKIQKNIPIIRCDRIKMTEVFLNLINNAIKFSSKNNKESPRVAVDYAEENEFHKFSVKDNGIGIDPQYHEQIFGLFKRLHTQEEYEGTGAGLHIVKRIIDDHNGEIWVESEPGKGAAFYFTIPKDIEKKKKKIGEILVEEGLITEENLKDALKKQEKDKA